MKSLFRPLVQTLMRVAGDFSSGYAEFETEGKVQSTYKAGDWYSFTLRIPKSKGYDSLELTIRASSPTLPIEGDYVVAKGRIGSWYDKNVNRVRYSFYPNEMEVWRQGVKV